MKKGELYKTDYGLCRITGTSKHGYHVKYISGKFEGKNACIEKSMMRQATRHHEKKETK
jgi:hypothetical protein